MPLDKENPTENIENNQSPENLTPEDQENIDAIIEKLKDGAVVNGIGNNKEIPNKENDKQNEKQ